MNPVCQFLKCTNKPTERQCFHSSIRWRSLGSSDLEVTWCRDHPIPSLCFCTRGQRPLDSAFPIETHPAPQPGVRALGFFILFVQFRPSFCMRTKVGPGTLFTFPILESFAVNVTVVSHFHLGLHPLLLLFSPSLTQTSKPVAGAPLPRGRLPGGQWSVCLSFRRKSASASPEDASSSSRPLQPT